MTVFLVTVYDIFSHPMPFVVSKKDGGTLVIGI